MFLQTLSCSFNYYVIKYVLYYNTFFEKFKGFYKTFIIKVIFRFSATFFTSPSPSLPQPPSPENMSPITPPSYLLSSAISFPHTGKPIPCPFPLHKKRTIFPTFCTEKSAEARCMPWRKVSPSSQFPSAVSAVT